MRPRLQTVFLTLLVVLAFPLVSRAQIPMNASKSPESNLKLWYDQPAQKWVEALALGNGRIGAMFFGDPTSELIALNDNTLYSGEPGSRDLPLDVTRNFDQVVGWLREGKYAEADEFVTKNWLGRGQNSYQPLGNLRFHFASNSPVTNYRRELDIATAIAQTTYKQNGTTFTREMFASFPAQALVIRLRASRARALNLRVELDSPHPNTENWASDDGQMMMRGQGPGLVVRRTLEWIEERSEQRKYPELFDARGQRLPRAVAEKGAPTVLYGTEAGGKGTRFETRLQVRAQGGRVRAEKGGLRLENCTEALLILSSGSSFNGFSKSPSREGADESAGARKALDQSAGKSFGQLRAEHVADYRALFGRVALDLGPPTAQSALPTDKRLEKYANGQDKPLAALYFGFARYLMIAGSRSGGQPLNLQGLWNDRVVPPWASGYTTNINAQMNYWLAEVGNLSECHEPFLRMVEELSTTGAKTAREMYGRPGWVAHHNNDIWRDTQPVDNVAQTSFWPVGAGWLCQHGWEHFQFSGDREFLRAKAYPLMKGAAQFYLSWLVDNGKGQLVTPISTSPENVFRYFDEQGKARTASVSMGATMDMAIIRELFANCITASKLLDVDEAFRVQLQSAHDKLLPFQIGKRGQLQEWQGDFEEKDPLHRHISHLYGLHPGNQISKRAAPELFEAARRTLELRGDEATGWSMAWKINFWARMEDGVHAYTLLQGLLSPSRTYPNLFDAHPPFQIDGNFGGAAGIAEMLLQSQNGEIHVLPALPRAWPAGEVKGLRARGGWEIDVKWSQGLLNEIRVKSLLGQACKVRYGEKTVEFPTRRGAIYVFTPTLQVVNSVS